MDSNERVWKLSEMTPKVQIWGHQRLAIPSLLFLFGLMSSQSNLGNPYATVAGASYLTFVPLANNCKCLPSLHC